MRHTRFPVVTFRLVILARPNDIFVDAVLYALVIMIVGFTGSLILKGLRPPGAAPPAAATNGESRQA